MKRKIFSVLLTLVLVLSLSLMTAVPVSAAALTNISVTPEDNTAGATTTYTIAFTTITALSTATIADRYQFTFPDGFDASSATVDTTTVTTGGVDPTLVSATVTVVTLDVAGSDTAGAQSIVLNGIVNTQTAGDTYVVAIETQDGDAAYATLDGPTNSGTFTITADTVAKLAFTVNPAGSVSGIAFGTQPTIEAQDQYGNINTDFADDITISVKTGPGALDIGTATQAMTSGTLTTSGLGYTATADQEDFTLAANDADTDLTEGVSGSVTCDVVATKILLTTEPADIISGVSMTQPVVTYVNSSNITDVDVDADVITATEDGAGTVAGDTATAADGVATFAALIYTAVADGEAVTFTFTDDVANLNLSTVPVDSSALTANVTATKLVFTVEPDGSASGVALTTQPVVQAQDADNTIDTDYVTDVVASEDDAGTLTGTLTITPVAGEATFTDLVYTATADDEVFQINVNSGTLTEGISAGVTCGVTATKLIIVTQPTGAGSGVAFVIQPVIHAVDDNGVLDEDYVTSCTVAKTTGTGTLVGAAVDPVAGVATFIGVKITEDPIIHDSYTLTFSSGGLTAVVSDSFKVYSKILDLNDAAWTLISTDDYILSSSGNTSVFEGSVTLKFVYTGSSYLSATIADLEPVEAIYVKTTGDDGWVGLNYSTTASPGASTKDLVAGWNLVSSANQTDAGAVLSPLRYVAGLEAVALATLVSQDSYNLNTGDWYIDATTWANVTGTMDPFDGYWVYMNAAKSFGVIP